MLAQHPDLQAFCSGALERMHDRALRAAGPVKSAAAVANEMMILLNIDLRIAQVRPRVERSVHPLPALRFLLVFMRFSCVVVCPVLSASDGHALDFR